MKKHLINGYTKGLFIFTILFIFIGLNSCKKEKIPVGNAAGPTSYAPGSFQGISEQNKVTPDEINQWFAHNQAFKPGLVFLTQAQHAVINGQEVVKVPLGTNSALFFTKSDGILQAFAYKWLNEKPDEKLFTGKIASYSFQDNTLRILGYSGGKMQGATAKPLKNNAYPGLKTQGIDELLARFWCWLNGGSWVDQNDLDNGGSAGADGEIAKTGCDYSSLYDDTTPDATVDLNGYFWNTDGNGNYTLGPESLYATGGNPAGGGANWIAVWVVDPANGCVINQGGSGGNSHNGDGLDDGSGAIDCTAPGGHWEYYKIEMPIVEPSDNDLNITPDPEDNDIPITVPDNAHLYGVPFPVNDPNAIYYTLNESDELIQNLQNGAIQEDPVEFYLIMNYKGSKMLDLSQYSIASNSIQVGEFTLCPTYDRNNNLLFYSAWRNAANGIELIIRADYLSSFRQNYKLYKSGANWFYQNGVPSKGDIQYAAGDYFKGLKSLWYDALHSPQWWAYAITTFMHASINIATPSPKTTLLKTNISSEISTDLQIPSSYNVTTSNKGGGVKFVNPNNPLHDYVRIMPGNPSSPNVGQQVPYVIRMLNGKALDINGNPVLPASLEAHIPVTQYKFNR